MKTKKTIKVGIMPRHEYQKHLIEVAMGTRKLDPEEPKIWFSSIESMCQILSTANMELLRVILEEEPQSITELAELSGRRVSNLSRTLKTFESAGLISLEERRGKKRPIFNADDLKVEISFKELCRQSQQPGMVAG